MRGLQSRGFKRFRRSVWVPQKGAMPVSTAAPKVSEQESTRRLYLRSSHAAAGQRQSLPERPPDQAPEVRPDGPTTQPLPVTDPAAQGQAEELAHQNARPYCVAANGIFRSEALALRPVDLSKHRPSAPLLNRLPASFWLRHRAIPWVQLGDTIAIAFATAEEAERQQQTLTAHFGPFIPVLAPAGQISSLLLRHFRTSMARQASHSVTPNSAAEHCSNMQDGSSNCSPFVLFSASRFCFHWKSFPSATVPPCCCFCCLRGLNSAVS